MTFIPNDGLEKINDKMHITGIIATLYINRMKNTIDNSLKLFHCSCWPNSSIMMIMNMVMQFANKSHKIEAPQKMGKFTPLAY